MRTPLPLALALLVGLSLAACTRDARTTPTLVSPIVHPVLVPTQPLLTGPVIAEGLLRRQGLTNYQYGTYILLDTAGRTLYALRATTLNLDPYADRPVHLIGTPVPGYPLADGPPLLDVTAIQATTP
jgi:hypothetical protein